MGDTYSEADIAEAAGALESRGIKWAWQMCQMDKDDWNGVPTGLKCATRSMLNRESQGVSANVSPPLTNDQQAFLLVANETGTAPRLSSGRAFTCMTGVGESSMRQVDLYVSMGQIMSIIGGLMLPIPLYLMREVEWPSAEASSAGWLVPMTNDGAFNVLCLASFFNFLFCVMDGSYSAFFATSHGRAIGAGFEQFDMSKTINQLLGKALLHQQIGFVCVVALVLWQSALLSHPLAWIVLFVSTVAPSMGVATGVIAGDFEQTAPLWVYHQPWWGRFLLLAASPLGWRALLGGTRLKERAEAQAADLRRSLGLEAAKEQAANGAAQWPAGQVGRTRV